jgi:uncharacterized protein YqfA (UPF0365 family)
VKQHFLNTLFQAGNKIMSYSTQYSILKMPVGQHRLWRQTFVAVLNAAKAIRDEATTTAHHAERFIWAKEAEQETESKVNEIRLRLIADTTIASAPNEADDSTVQTVVDSLVNDFAVQES